MQPNTDENAAKACPGRPKALSDLNHGNTRARTRERPANSKKDSAGNCTRMEPDRSQLESRAQTCEKDDAKAYGKGKGK